jgi:lipopolysaccharide biosynthesis regulator YciM
MQIQTYWLLLIPLLFGLGWIAARWEMRLQEHEDDVEQAKKERSTFRGINLLLNEQLQITHIGTILSKLRS